MRCTTLTQLPPEFCEGSAEKVESLPALIFYTSPDNLRPGYVYTVTVTGLPSRT